MSLLLCIITLILSGGANANSYGYAPSQSQVPISTTTPAPAVSHENVTVVQPTTVTSEIVPGTKVNITTTTKRVDTNSETKEMSPSVFNVVPIEFNAETGTVAIDEDTLVPMATVVTSYGKSGEDLHQLDRVEETKTFDVSMPGGIAARLNSKNATDVTVDSKAGAPAKTAAVENAISDLANGLRAEGKVNENATISMTMANNKPVVSALNSKSNSSAEFAPGTSIVDLDILANELGKASVLSPAAQTVAKKVNQTIGKDSESDSKKHAQNSDSLSPASKRGQSVFDELNNNGVKLQPTPVPTPPNTMDLTGPSSPSSSLDKVPNVPSTGASPSSNTPNGAMTPSSSTPTSSSSSDTGANNSTPSSNVPADKTSSKSKKTPSKDVPQTSSSFTGPMTPSSSSSSTPSSPSNGSSTPSSSKGLPTPSSSNGSSTPSSSSGSSTPSSSNDSTTPSPANAPGTPSSANGPKTSSDTLVPPFSWNDLPLFGTSKVAMSPSPAEGPKNSPPSNGATTPSSSNNGLASPSASNGAMTPSSSNNGPAAPSSSNGSTTPSSFNNGPMTPSASNGSPAPSPSNTVLSPSPSNGSSTPSPANGPVTTSGPAAPTPNGSMTSSSSNGTMIPSVGSTTLSSSNGPNSPSTSQGRSNSSATPLPANGPATPSAPVNGSMTPPSPVNGSSIPSTNGTNQATNGSMTPYTSTGSITPSSSNGSTTPSAMGPNMPSTPSSPNAPIAPSSPTSTSNGPMAPSNGPLSPSNATGSPSSPLNTMTNMSGQPSTPCPGCAPSMGSQTPFRPGAGLQNSNGGNGRFSNTLSVPNIISVASFGPKDVPSTITVMAPGSITNVPVRSSPSRINGTVPVNGGAFPSNNTAFGPKNINSLLNTTLPNSSSNQSASSSPFLPIRVCNYSIGNVSAYQINDYIRSADASGIPIMTMATCEEIASYIANYPRPSVSGPEFCHQIGQQPVMPAVKTTQVNKEGFVWIMLPKIPVEVVDLTQSTIILGELNSDGSVNANGLSVANAVSDINGPLFTSIVAEGMTMTPIDEDLPFDLKNSSSPLDVVVQDVVEVTESTLIHNELFADGSIKSSGVSVASAVSQALGPLVASVVAQDITLTPADDELPFELSNGTSGEDSPLTILDDIVYEYPVGPDDDYSMLSPFLSDDADFDSDMESSRPDSLSHQERPSPMSSSTFGVKPVPESAKVDVISPRGVRGGRSPSFEDNVAPVSPPSGAVPSSGSVQRSPPSSRYALRQ